jgi:hypothetical protein
MSKTRLGRLVGAFRSGRNRRYAYFAGPDNVSAGKFFASIFGVDY